MEQKAKYRHWVEAWDMGPPPKREERELGRSGPFYERAAAEKFAAGLAATGRATRSIISTEKSETGSVWSPVVEL